MSRRRTRISWSLWCAGCLVAGVALTIVLVRPPQWLVRQWLRAWPEISDDEWEDRVTLLAETERSGAIAALEGLHESRPERVAAASRQLRKQLEQWRQLPPPEQEPRLAWLAHELANRVESMGPHGRGAASKLAMRILAWPLSPGQPARRSTLRDCERVVLYLRDAPRPASRERPETALPEIPTEIESSLPGADPVLPRPLVGDHILARSAEDPGGGLAPELAEIPPLPPVLERSIPRTRSEPPLFVPPSLVEPGTFPGYPEPSPGGALSPVPWDNEPIPLPAPGTDLSVSRPPVPEPLGRAPNITLRGLPWMELVPMLASPNTDPGRDARTELLRRGFTPLEVDIATRAVDPDPAARRQLIDDLPDLPVDARPWLVFLARDSNDRVRSAAYGVMMAHRDSRLHDELRRRLQVEQDDELRRRLERWNQRNR